MISDRLRANLIYLVILSAVSYGIYNLITDKAYPTGKVFSATVISIAPIYSRHSIKVLVTIRSESGLKITRTADESSKFRVGQKLELKEYQSKRRGIKKYKIIRWNIYFSTPTLSQ